MGELIFDLPFVKYRQLPGLSVTNLKELGRSPLHFQHRLTNPYQSTAMSLGTAAHAAILEPAHFERDFVVFPGARRAGKEWEAFQEANAGATIMKQDELDLVKGMRDAVLAHPAAAPYFKEGYPEVSMTWTDLEHQVACRGRIDWLIQGEQDVLVGLKSAKDASHRAFARQAANLGYHLQWAYYAEGYRLVTGSSAKVVEIVVESAPPHEVAVYVIGEDILAAGFEEFRLLLGQYVTCQQANTWGPALPEEVELQFPSWVFLQFPSWVFGSGDDASDLGLEFGESA